ncbi:hypothetical protein [Sphingobacterium sp.]|uniref:hypothetical protein n=1 Tax=Sphingobacterium sp. TaxID=341027 RepID=UPI0028A1CB43|nr:hypothetical protein [Sphingobacterium sp.]
MQGYRHLIPFRIVGEVVNWHGLTVEQVKSKKEALAKVKRDGIRSLNEGYSKEVPVHFALII